MKKLYYNSLSEFYDDVKNVDRHQYFDYMLNSDRAEFTGLSLSKINQSKFTYDLGVDALKKLVDVTIEKDEKMKFWNQFDGYDIDIDRMYEGMDFLLDTRKQKKQPKTVDLFVNITEGVDVSYKAMLNKTYAALKIIDHLESLGIRTALYASIASTEILGTGKSKLRGEQYYIEICLKNHSDSVNMGALCTAISPWFFRHWVLAFMVGRNRNINANFVGFVSSIPVGEAKGIVIQSGQCHTLVAANKFIESINVNKSLIQ